MPDFKNNITQNGVQVVLVDGSKPLTSNWDIGEDRVILTERFDARDNEGISIYDDGGNPIIVGLDGGTRLGLFTADIEAIAAGFKGIQLSATGYLLLGNSGGYWILENAYFDSGGWKRRTAAPASIYQNTGGEHEYLVGPTGAADSTITWSSVQKLDSSSRVLIQQILRAMTSSGLRLEDDGGNPALIILDGGNTGVKISPTTALGVQAGSSTNDAAVGGVLYVTTTQGANVGTGEDDLASYSVPANTLAVNNQSLWFKAWGSFAANGNNKQIRARFGTSGTNLMFDSGAVAVNGQDWYLEGEIFRTGAATQKSVVLFGRSVINVDSVTALNQTLSGAVTLKITGEAVSNNDILLEGFKVGWDDANT